MKAVINKILEIDMDTERDVHVYIGQLSSVQYNRSRPPDGTLDIKDNIIILSNALAACILRAEAEGVCKPGEGMKKATEILNLLYVSPTAELIYGDRDKKGNFIQDES